MGLLDSIFRTAVRRTVSKVVDHAVDEAIGNMKNNNQPAQAQPQNRTCTIFKPNLSGNIVKHEGYSAFAEREINFVFELPEKLFESDCGAAEVPVYYVVANSFDEFVNLGGGVDSKLPEIHIDDSGSMKEHISRDQNVVMSKVENHPFIVEKYEYDSSSEYVKNGMTRHNISYIFYLSDEDKAKNCECALTLTYDDTMNQEICGYAIQAFNLIASTLRIEKRDSDEE